MDAIRRFEEWEPDFRPENAIANARRFSPANFDKGFREAVEYFRTRELQA